MGLDIQAIIEDGIVDAAEVNTIRKAIYGDDGRVDWDEFGQLCEINDGVSGNANDPSWSRLFAYACGCLVLEDDESPGEIDEGEAARLMELFSADGKIDDVEKGALAYVLKHGSAVHQSLKDYAAAAGVPG